ncbi:acyl-CoA dehydrogenase family protein [Skermania piniformis]|uniref:Acyl-CoA/acyl-ACP dehydrogenase n=1 Tax=Skermania pinensis TaxID=39122 RepID=A0ABX8SA44_9ACTN|nr:acyl-CoA dehydrogenase family protein [Skermania piniformis]QXQ14052.1 acyl-CoA/acyl-ACP dehydrogenase [Skermania piniformis]
MSIEFTLTEAQAELRDTARVFAATHLAPLVEQVRTTPDPYQAALLTRPAHAAAVRAGLLKGMIPEIFGGTMNSGVDAAIVTEELAAVMPDFVAAMAGVMLALTPVYLGGDPEQTRRFLAPFLAGTGSPQAVMALSEPAGSANFAASPPAAGLQTTAVLDGDEWVITGEKQWSANLGGWDGAGPDLMVVACRTPGGVSLIGVERAHVTRENLVVLDTLDMPGLRGHLTQRVRLEQVRVPRHNLIGPEGLGAELTYAAFTASGAAVGLLAVGSMRAAFDIAFRFAKEQTRGGDVPIIGHRPVSDILGDAKGRIEAVRLLSWRALDAVVGGQPGALELALHAKIFGSETAVDVINQLIRVVGVTAYDRNFPLVHHLLDALAYPIFEGGNIGVRRRQLADVLAADGWHPLTASGLK